MHVPRVASQTHITVAYRITRSLPSIQGDNMGSDGHKLFILSLTSTKFPTKK